MNRLRVRVELNRRKAGVPLDELVSVVEETRKFFHLLAEDVEIPVERGEWEASNFDPESLNFTAEYNGPASADQIRAFGSAFGGATSLRRETIAQFTHIADFLGEDELVGFGLYQSDQESEPSDWRCLSRRDASRFADEIRLLAKATGETGAEASMPAVMNGSVGGRRIFKDRRERETLATDPSKWIRDVESTLSRRISLLERELESHANKMHGLGNTQEAADERFLKLLGAMESFWSQAPRQLPSVAAELTEYGRASLGEDSHTIAGRLLESAPAARPRKSWRRWRFGLACTAVGLVLAAIGFSKMAGDWSRFSWSLNAHGITRPVSSSSIQPVAASSNAPLVETALVRPAPEANNPPLSAGQQKTVSTGSASSPTDDSPQIQTKRPRSESETGPLRQEPSGQTIHQISLEVPPEFKATIREQVLINVTVDIDQRGKVIAAAVSSTKGEEAALLTTEALKVARWFRFQPARRGKKAVTSQTVLSFVFDPPTEVSLPESLPSAN